MIIVSIHGGLGNQMFQYAFGKAVSERLKVPLMLDTTFYGSSINSELQHPREFGLSVFNLVPKVANESELSRYCCKSRSISLKLLHKLNRLCSGNHLFKEKYPLCFDKDFRHIKDNTYITGYWQSEKYFMEIRDTILDEFTLRKQISTVVKDFKSRVAVCNSISLHIRRGDYTMDSARNFHGLLSLDYYKKALEIMKNKLDNPVFFIFSDDPEWVLANFKIGIDFQVVSGDKVEASEEMYLMSNCKHNIIANSSFSWWGAWLNGNPDKIVIAPKNWIVTMPKNAQIIPKGWIEI